MSPNLGQIPEVLHHDLSIFIPYRGDDHHFLSFSPIYPKFIPNSFQCLPSRGCLSDVYHHFLHETMIHRIGLWENLQESPIFDGKKPWFPVDFPLNQSIE